METRIINLCAKVRSAYREKTARKYEQVSHTVRNFIIRWGELESVYVAEEKFQTVKDQLKVAKHV